MNKKRVLGLVVVGVTCAIVTLIGVNGGASNSGTVLDKNGKIIAEIMIKDGILEYDCDNTINSYVDIVCKETTEIIMEKEQIGEGDAKKRIVKDKMQIETTFDQAMFEHIKDVAEDKYSESKTAMAVAISDTNGHMLACYSISTDNPNANYVNISTYAGSTIKPLSVYALGIEANKISWSSLYSDSPYTQVKDENGEWVNWPVNGNPYTNEMITIEEAIKKSNNAVAVKVLKECGVTSACTFLENSFNMNVSEEQHTLKTEGEDSVLSNIALGYLAKGVTLQEMLSDYQIFANGGVYQPLKTVTQMKTKKSLNYYQDEEKGKNVISPQTAYIMNRLLSEVVKEDGTGKAAMIQGMDVCGKTGTSSGFRDNWFVGMTPEYLCAVWYGSNQEIQGKNDAPEIFHDVMTSVGVDTSVSYEIPNGVEWMAYCKKTGCLANEHCVDTGMGCFNVDNLPVECSCQ